MDETKDEIKDEAKDETKDETKNISFFYDICDEVKHFYESPVIFLLKIDYSNEIFNVLCSMLTNFLSDKPEDEMIDIITDYHLNWLRFVNQYETYKETIIKVSKEEVCEAISFTLDAVGNRFKYFQKFIQSHSVHIPITEQPHIQTELEIIGDMHAEVIQYLQKKLLCFKTFTDLAEFQVKLNVELENLFVFLDKTFDEGSIILSKYISIHISELSGDLTKTLQFLVDEIHNSQATSSQKLMEELKKQGQNIGQMVHHIADHKLEITMLEGKIAILEDRIDRFKSDKSAAVMALKHKKEFLVRKLESLENLKTDLNTFRKTTQLKLEVCDEEKCVCEDFYQLKIFNHLLPKPEREKLVSELCRLWNVAIFGLKSRSLISIMSSNDIGQEYTDEIGTFFVDVYGRKIYKKPDDEAYYQLNELNKLIEVNDDEDHIYFYDECGRYFVDKISKKRIYKAENAESEYMMDSSGVLMKSKEVQDGVIYYYDKLGRYYIDETGKQVYRDPDSVSEYENDGLGNLIRIRPFMEMFDPCPDDANVTEDFKYLKITVGHALKECISEVVLRQPADPLKYLSARLIKYRQNSEFKERLAREKEALDIEREAILAEQRALAEKAALEASLFAQGGSEASYDSNVVRYKHEALDDTISIASK